MFKHKVYISAPISESMRSVELFARRFPSEQFEVKFWDRLCFNQRDFDDAEKVIFMLPGNSFHYEVQSLPVGVKKEVENSINLHKEIYVAYVTANGDYNIYHATIQRQGVRGERLITGVAGTANKIFENTEADGRSLKPHPVHWTDSYKASHFEDNSGSLRDTFKYAVKVPYEELETEEDERLLLMLS